MKRWVAVPCGHEIDGEKMGLLRAGGEGVTDLAWLGLDSEFVFMCWAEREGSAGYRVGGGKEVDLYEVPVFEMQG